MDNIHVTTHSEPEPTETPAAADSPLANLRQIRERKLAALIKDFKVPRWDEEGGPAIYIRCKPIDAAVMDRRLKIRQRTKKDDWAVLYNADLLINTCVKIYAKQGDDIVGEWTSFGPELAEDLGVPEGTADVIARALFFTDGDLMTVVRKLGEWSGLSLPDAEDELLGE